MLLSNALQNSLAGFKANFCSFWSHGFSLEWICNSKDIFVQLNFYKFNEPSQLKIKKLKQI